MEILWRRGEALEGGQRAHAPGGAAGVVLGGRRRRGRGRRGTAHRPVGVGSRVVVKAAAVGRRVVTGRVTGEEEVFPSELFHITIFRSIQLTLCNNGLQLSDTFPEK